MAPAALVTAALLILWPALASPAAEAQVQPPRQEQSQDSAAALSARYAALRPALAASAFGQPLLLESTEGTNTLQGDIHARVDQPFAVVAPALQRSENWCDIMMLHLNVKRCRTQTGASGEKLSVLIGTKVDQPLVDAFGFEFQYRTVVERADYLRVELRSDQGPMGTSDYRFVLQAMPVAGGQTFIHLSYAYGFGTMARVAMQAYLSTSGRNKVGFSVTGRSPDGQPEYIRGTRGVVERNTMRYYLAIVAYLDSLALPAARQLDDRLNRWHTAVERYPLQLHEIERDAYLTLKRKQAEPGL